jgi:hypothetical protein
MCMKTTTATHAPPIKQTTTTDGVRLYGFADGLVFSTVKNSPLTMRKLRRSQMETFFSAAKSFTYASALDALASF